MNTCAVVLNCGCELKRVKPGVTVPVTLYYCVTHGYQGLNTIHLQEWRVRCFDPEQFCHYSRWCGQSEKRARRLAKLHVQPKGRRGHRVFVAYDTITANGKGIILAGAGVRWHHSYAVETSHRDLPIYTATATLQTAAADAEPPPF